uniref:Uncharacterized protein n=1 Tax=Oryza brachyantha TaxID=4533 RepID=J3N7L1_ORYBR
RRPGLRRARRHQLPAGAPHRRRLRRRPLVPHRQGHRHGGEGAVQPGAGGGADHLVPQRQHLQGPTVGPRPGDPRRGPHHGEQVRRRLRPGPAGELAGDGAADLRLLQARHGVRPRGLERRPTLQLQRQGGTGISMICGANMTQ